MPAVRFTTPASASKVASVRRRAVAQLRSWGAQLDDDTAGAVALIVSELVTNAVLHTDCRLLLIGLSLRRGRILVEVYDGSSTLPSLRTATEDDEGGRGLALVGLLADRHGAEATGWGKKSWAELVLPPSSPARRRVCRRHLVALRPSDCDAEQSDVPPCTPIARGEAPAWQSAYLTDRCLVAHGLPQVCGTQYVNDDRGPASTPSLGPGQPRRPVRRCGPGPHAEYDAQLRSLDRLQATS